MKCPACNNEYDDDFEYCPYCGADNLEVDRIRAEYDKQNEESVEEPIIGPNTKTIQYRMRYGHYTADCCFSGGNSLLYASEYG